MKKKEKLGRKLLAFLLTLAMLVGLMPGMGLTAYAATFVSYKVASVNATTHAVTFDDASCETYTVVTADTTTFEDGKWYVVSNSVTVSSRITVTGTVNLILCDGATLTASKGITVNSGNTINIYAQIGGTGELNAGSDLNVASIGGGARYQSSGTVNIHGGKITATGGSNASGIGGALDGGNGEVNIYGGNVTARGKNYAAGIGGYSKKSGGTVNIYGGTVNASGSQFGTTGIGIGGTNPGNCVVHIYGGEVTATSEKAAAGIQGTVTIDGGTVTATGGVSDSISSFGEETYSSNGINGTVTVNGGTVTAFGGNVTGGYAAIESYGGTIYACSGINGTVTISGGTVTATGGNVTGDINNSGGTIYACNGVNGTVTISGGTVTATGGSHTGNSSGTTVKEKGFGGSLTIGDGMKVFGGDNADPTTEIEKSNDDYARFKYMLVKLGHVHSFTYEANDATIKATCSQNDCTLNDGQGNHTAILTIGAPTLNTYGQTGAGISAEATITDADNIKGTATVVYKKGDETLASAPTDAGTYTASIMLGTATASVEYTINKAEPTANAPEATATYGQTLADVTLTNPTGNTEGNWAFVDPTTTSVGAVGDHTFKANFIPNDTANYNSKSDVDVKVTVGKAANPATVSSTASVTKGGNTVDLKDNVALNGATDNVSYAIGGEANGCTLSGSTLTSGDTAGTVTVNVTVAEDDNYNASAAMPITVTISDKQTQTITADDVTVTYGDTGKSISATTDGGGTLCYAVKEGSGEYIDVDEDGKLTIKKVGTATVIVTAAETSTYTQATKEVTVTINKANAVPATVTANNRTVDGTDKPLVTVAGEATGGEMRYALGENAITAPAENLYTTSIPTATDAGTYYVWYKVVGDENHNDVEPECVKVTIAEEKKQDEPVKPEEPETPAKTVDMYRLYNPNSGEHFYTANAAEKDNLVSLGWTYEGIGWKAPEKSNTPVYRVYNPNAGDHHYTTNKAEKDLLISIGWKDEGIGWYSDDTQSLPIYRQYNPNAVSGAHNFTSSKGENDWLISVGWNGEGIGWYGVK